jgi:putative colanic acid biosynthesis acetyltransferase WcaF
MPIKDNDPFTQPSFSLRNRVARGIWGIVWLLLFRPSPRPFHGWRRMLLRLFGTVMGNHVNVYPNVKVWAPWALQIGNRVGIADGVRLYNMAPMVIGDNCVISQGAHLCGGTHDVDSANFQLLAKPITLGSNVWICAEAFVGPGVHIADGCVIGARGVVCKSIPAAWSLWAGNPAVFKRMRRQPCKA